MSTEIVRNKLESIKSKLDKGSVNEFVKKTGFQKVSVLGDKSGTSPLPTLTGEYRNYDIHLDLMPYPEGGFLLNLEIKIECPFKLMLTRENTEIKSEKFKGSRRMLVQEIEIGVKDFDDAFFIETLDSDSVTSFLSDGETRDIIFKLEDFDCLVFQYKHFKVVYFVENVESFNPDQVFNKIVKMAELSDKITNFGK